MERFLPFKVRNQMKFKISSCFMLAGSVLSLQAVRIVGNKTSQPIYLHKFETRRNYDFETSSWILESRFCNEPIVLESGSEIDIAHKLGIEQEPGSGVTDMAVTIDGKSREEYPSRNYRGLDGLQAIVFIEDKDGAIVMSIPYQ